jgi:RNA polymerase sigma factor (sigma-70 family)
MSDTETLNSSICEHGLVSTARKAETPRERVADLYAAHRNKIYRYLLGQGMEPALAQEHVQEVFVRCFVSLRKGTKIVSEQAWLYGVASKMVMDHWRRKDRPLWAELDAMPDVLETLPSPSATPESELLHRERLLRVTREMTRLPGEQRRTLHLRMQGLRYRAIAKILGVSVSTIAEWLTSAVDRLRSVADE